MNQVEDVNYFIINTIKYYIRDCVDSSLGIFQSPGPTRYFL